MCPLPGSAEVVASGEPGCKRCEQLARENKELEKKLDMCQRGQTCEKCRSTDISYRQEWLLNCARGPDGEKFIIGMVRCGSCRSDEWACWDRECRSTSIIYDNSSGEGVSFTCGRCHDSKFDDWSRRTEEDHSD